MHCRLLDRHNAATTHMAAVEADLQVQLVGEGLTVKGSLGGQLVQA